MDRSKKRRYVPKIHYSINKLEDYKIITGMKDIQKKVFDNVVWGIKYGIENKKKTVDIFKIVGSDQYINLPKSSWKESLENAIRFYSQEGIEEYEKCSECQKLIESL